jgi:hypothetical protein
MLEDGKKAYEWGYSLPKEYRGKDKSKHRKNASEPVALTS